MAAKKPKESKVGTVEHYYPKAHAAAVGLEGDLKVGDTIHIKGHGDDVTEKVTSLQLDHKPIAAGHAGQHIGVQVDEKVHRKAEVFKVEGAQSPAKKAAVKAPAAKKTAKKAPKRAKAAKKAAKKAPKRAKKAAKKAPKRAKKAATKRSPAKRSAKAKPKAAKKANRKAPAKRKAKKGKR